MACPIIWALNTFYKIIQFMFSHKKALSANSPPLEDLQRALVKFTVSSPDNFPLWVFKYYE